MDQAGLSASDTAEVPPLVASRTAARNRLLGPPGVLFYVATAVAILIALDANSRASLRMFLTAAPVWVILAAIWTIRFVGAAWTERLRFPRRAWLRWLAVPAAMGLVFVLTRYDVPFDARLAASRGAMDQMAAEVRAGASTDRAWVGLYPVHGVERIPDGVRFLIDDSGLGTIGFAYSSVGRPVSLGDDPLWCCDSYVSIGGGWWIWYQEWD